MASRIYLTSMQKNTDTLSEEKRKEIMSHIRSKNTKPEYKVRSTLHRMGFRFRLHCVDLPGTPDIVLPKYRTVIFVHGCFWHQHPLCKRATMPVHNADFWKAKFERNLKRDAEKVSALKALGWRVLIIWECETKKVENLSERLREVLTSGDAV